MSYMTIGADLDKVYTDESEVPAGDVFVDHNGNTYKFYQYDTGAGSVAAAAGNVAYFYAPGGTSAGATTVVTSDLSDSAEVGAGVLQAAPGDGEYCWLQVTGSATLNTSLTAGGSDGDELTPTGSTDGTLDAVDATSTTAVNADRCAVAIDYDADIIMCRFAY